MGMGAWTVMSSECLPERLSKVGNDCKPMGLTNGLAMDWQSVLLAGYLFVYKVHCCHRQLTACTHSHRQLTACNHLNAAMASMPLGPSDAALTSMSF